MMKVVLIPGMDGTGTLFGPFIEVAPAGIEVVYLPLLQKSGAGYDEQAKHIIDGFGEEPIILVAESYSGMIAYSMLKMGCSNIRHIVFAASFIARPSRLASLAKYVPIALLEYSIIPKSLMGKFLFGRYSTPELISLFYKSIDSVENDVLRHRLTQIAMIENPSIPIKVPCSYIRPRNDILVSKNSIDPFQRLCSKLSVYEIEGTHFILQTNPKKCWQVIQSAIVWQSGAAG